MQRNKLLKDTGPAGDRQHLKVWDDLLIEHGAAIIVERDRLIKAIDGTICGYYSRFDKETELTISYRPKIDSIETDIRTAMTKHLETYRQRELRAGLTLVGPHRDRLEININGRSVRHYGSRGQKRCVMIAMKLAAADHLSHIKGEPVTLVLDEVFAELDSMKAKALMDALSGYRQVFIATAGEFNFEGDHITRLKIDNGKVNRVNNDPGI